MTHPFKFDMEFDDAERELGVSFLENSDVVLDESAAPGTAEAVVRHFKRRVVVWMRFEGDHVVEHGCDCPHFEDHGKGCEHLYALALAIGDESEESVADDEESNISVLFVLDGDSSHREKRLVFRLSDADGRSLRADSDTWAALDRDEDENAFRVLGAATGGIRPLRDGGGFVRPEPPFHPEGAAARDVIRAFGATGRLHLLQGETIRRIEVGPTRSLVAAVLIDDDGISLSGRLAIDDSLQDGTIESIIAGETPCGVLADEIFEIECHGADELLERLAHDSIGPVEAGDLTEWLARLEVDVALPRLAIDDELLPLAKGRPKPRIVIHRRRSLATVDVSFSYEDRLVEIHARSHLVLDTEASRQSMRDPSAEDDAVRVLMAAGAEADPDRPGGFTIDGDAVVALALTALESGAEVLVDDRRVDVAKSVDTRVRCSTDWFAVDGTVETERNPVSLASLLDGMHPSEDLAVLEDAVLLLDEETARQVRRLAPLAGLSGSDDLRFTGAQAAIARGIFDVVGLDTPPAFDVLIERFGTPDDTSVSIPVDLQAELRPYQQAGFFWMVGLARLGLGGVLADEMGLGKTVQAIAFLLGRAGAADAPFLVVVPRSLVSNWKAELERFAPVLDVVEYTGSGRRAEFNAGEIVITTWGILRRDIDVLAAIPFDTVIADEAQAIKNAASRTAVAAHRLEARHRFLLTGTPIENDASELWSLLQLAQPGLLGDRAAFVRHVHSGDNTIRAAIGRGLAPVILRRTKREVAPELPDLIEQTVLCDMSDNQAAQYAQLAAAARKDLVANNDESPRPSRVLETILRLRQIACCPALVSDQHPKESAKLDMLFERIDELRENGRKALVFSQFTSLLDIVRERLEEREIGYAWLTGKTRNREEQVRLFQDTEDCRVFCISLLAGGTGLNLTAADAVFILDPWWNPAVEDQAIARAHRIGREGAVIAQRLVSRGTIEESVLTLQQQKRELVQSILEGASDKNSRLSTDDLVRLLS